MQSRPHLSLIELLASYGSYHRDARNRLTHFIRGAIDCLHAADRARLAVAVAIRDGAAKQPRTSEGHPPLQ